jgi:alkylation response protein AidB-like acyl-CoA dehydrogenase
MDFNFSDEQQMLQDAARRFLAKEYGSEARRAILGSASGFSRSMWQGLADLGLLSLGIPEDLGGMGGGPVETMLVMGALGESLVLEPYLASAVLATQALLTIGSRQQCESLLPPMMEGRSIAVLAHGESGSRYDRMAIAMRAWQAGGGYILDGHKRVLAHAPCADHFIVTARLAETGNVAPAPLLAFWVRADTPGLRMDTYRTVDGVSTGELRLSQIAVPASALLGEECDASAALASVLDRGIAAVCAEAIGALDKLLAATISYTNSRKQFGSPLAKFQALQHRMAEMVLHIEQARSMSYLAAVRASDSDTQLRAAAMSAAKVVTGEACRFVGQQAVQLHGGMGVTDELEVSHYFKRLMAIELQFGSTQQHLENYARTLA